MWYPTVIQKDGIRIYVCFFTCIADSERLHNDILTRVTDMCTWSRWVVIEHKQGIEIHRGFHSCIFVFVYFFCLLNYGNKYNL